MYEVSIIIPVYNVEAYIRASLLSALGQTFDSIEYILVDDCGTDRSMTLAREVIAAHPRRSDVRIVQHSENQGLSAARNTGMNAATGKYVFFLDSDDELTPDCIALHHRAITESEADFSIADIRLVGARSIHVHPIPMDAARKSLLSSFFRREWSVSAWNKLYCRNFLTERNLTFRPGLLHEDILWSYQLCLSGGRAAWVREQTYVYKIRGGSITSARNMPRKVEHLLFIYGRMTDDWASGQIPAAYGREYAHFMGFALLNTALLLLNFGGTHYEAICLYHELRALAARLPVRSVTARVLRLPFGIFRLLFSLPYRLYKQQGR